jgi:P-type E1-E2 ATPase
MAGVRLRDVVPPDVIRLSAGDLVPADSRLIEAHDLSVRQSVLMGESLPAEKTADPRDASIAVRMPLCGPSRSAPECVRLPATKGPSGNKCAILTVRTMQLFPDRP